MEKSEMLRIARIAILKNWDFEELKYSDYLYGREHFADEIWEFVEECIEIGRKAFEAKYQGAER